MRGKLVKWGNSIAIRFPASVLDIAGFSLGEEVEIAAGYGVVELWSKRRRPIIEELFAEAEKNGPLEPPEVDENEWNDIAPKDEEMDISSAPGQRPAGRR
jgi:antitoxin component of MazEF toxin-antitoxin module